MTGTAWRDPAGLKRGSGDDTLSETRVVDCGALRTSAYRVAIVAVRTATSPRIMQMNIARVAAPPVIAVVVLTTFAEDDSVFGALRAGARGYLTKDAGADEIVRALTLAVAGEAMLDPAVQRRLVDAIGTAPPTPAPVSGARTPPDDLTHREVEVLTLELAPIGD